MKNNKYWLYVIPALYWAPGAFADYKDDIGYTALAGQLGTNVPTGLGVNVTQVEASAVSSTDANYPAYAPDTTDPQFAGKSFNFPATASVIPSVHATGVGARFYGSNAMAYGITNITSYETNEWITSIASNSVSAPANGSRIANHSWVGQANTVSDTSTILRFVDRQVQRNEFIQIVGMDNSTRNNPLLGNAYNVIAVGRTDGGHDKGSYALDSTYVSGRTRPDLVAPQSTTSGATPIVSSAAALLVETGHSGGAALSDGSTNVNGIGTIYNAERSETIKAALMAGADRSTSNTSTTADIADYRSNGHQTTNGLDDRYGAGQLNIFHSFQIIAAGEQNSDEDTQGVGNGQIDLAGFDYDANFGGSQGSNSTATYRFDAESDLNLTASLVWNLGVSNDGSLTTTLHDLDLELFDVSTQTTAAFSDSTIDNTENLWINVAAGHSYELLVKSGEANGFNWDYALAWYMSPIQAAPVPVPAAFYLFGTAIAGVGFIGRRKAA